MDTALLQTKTSSFRKDRQKLIRDSFKTVKEARKLLGKDYREVPDDQIEYIVSLLGHIAQQTVQDFGSIYSF